MRPTTTLAALILITSSATGIQQSPPDRPNVVLVMTDDAGYADIGSYDAPDIRTPNIDSLARDGIKLTDFYANAMSCTPTRAGLIAGRYQQRYGVEFVLPAPGLPGSDGGLPPLAHSLPLLMKKNGYATALVGKWHLGYRHEFSPRAHGFDLFFGYKSAAIDYYTHFTTRPSEGAQFVSGQPDLWEDDAPIEQDGYMTDPGSDRHASAIRCATRRDQPVSDSPEKGTAGRADLVLAHGRAKSCEHEPEGGSQRRLEIDHRWRGNANLSVQREG